MMRFGTGVPMWFGPSIMAGLGVRPGFAAAVVVVVGTTSRVFFALWSLKAGVIIGGQMYVP